MARLFRFLFKNLHPSQTIIKNTFWLFFGQTASRLFRAFIVVYAARTLGAASWGAFSYALGIATFLTVFSDIGINALITKEATRNPELKQTYLATAFFLKLGLVAVFIAAAVLFFPYLTNIQEAAALMPILIFVFAFDTLRDLGSSLARALERMEIEAGVSVFTNLAIAVAGFSLLYTQRTSTALAWGYAIGSGIGFAVIMYVLRRHFRNLIPNFHVHLLKPILTRAWPFGLMGLMGAIMLNTDIVMLGWMRTPEEVGYYSVAQKLIQLLYVLPSLLATSAFPLMARIAKSDPSRTKALLEKMLALVFVIAIPLIAVGIAFAHPLIAIIFGSSYLPAVATLQILFITLLMVYPSMLLGNALFAYDEERLFTIFVTTAAIGNAVLNYILIRPFGIEGAALSTVFTQIVTIALLWRAVYRINRFSPLQAIKRFIRI